MQPQLKPSQSQWSVSGSRSLCRIIVNRDFDRARQILEITPSLINVRHPLGWAPLHVVVLCGDASLVKFVLDLPSLDLGIKDISTFDDRSSEADITSRHKELCPEISRTEDTSGATALHYACMRGDPEILNLLSETPVSYHVFDNANRSPAQYFDVERTSLETLKSYNVAFDAWYIRWRSFVKNDVDAGVLCAAISGRDWEYCKEIVEAQPNLSNVQDQCFMKAIQDIALSRKPADINPKLLKEEGPRKRRYSYSSEDGDYSQQGHRSTPLHHACLVGDMRTVEILLTNGAEWIDADDSNTLPQDYVSTLGNSKIEEFKHLCEEERLRREKREQEKREQEKREQEEKEQKEKENEANVVEEGVSKEQEDVEEVNTAEEDDSKSDGTSSDEEERELEKKKIEEEAELHRRYLEIEKVIGDKMIGQRGPIRSVASAIRLRGHGWVDPDRPLVMLFLGSSGVGKTEVAKRVAYFLHGDKIDDKPTFGQSLTEMEKQGMFTRIDMSEYQQSHTVATLTGSPKGYVGYDDGGVLTQRLKKNPKAIVLLDEIEKAHPDVLTVFLQLFDDGRITDPKDGTIYCPGAVFIMTSNLGSEQIRAAAPRLHELIARTENRPEMYIKGIKKFTKGLYPKLKAAFKRDEFLGRINQMVVFLPFEAGEVAQIVEIEMNKWKKRAEEQHSITLSWTRQVVDRIARGYDVNFGARSVINEVHRLAIQTLAESHIKGDIQKNWLAHIFIDKAGNVDRRRIQLVVFLDEDAIISSSESIHNTWT